MGTLSSKGVCDPRAFAPSNCHCHRRGLCHRRAFAIEEPLPLSSKATIAIEGSLLSMGLWHQMAFAIEGPFAIEGHLVLRALCRRRPFAIEGPFPWKSLFFAFKGSLTLASKDLSLLMRLPLPSKGVCHDGAFAVEWPLSSKGLWLQSALAFAFEVSSMVMQHPPTQPYQDSSDCEKRGCLLVPFVQFTLCL